MSTIEYPSTARINEITIESDQQEFLCAAKNIDSPTGDTVHLVLTRGAATRKNPEKNRSELHISERHGGKCQIYGSENEGIAAFLATLGVFGYKEKWAYNIVRDSPLDIRAYDEYRSTLSKKDRARYLINDSKDRIRTLGSHIDTAILSSPESIDYDASFRSTNPSEEGLEIARTLQSQLPSSTVCYRNAFEAVTQWDDDRLKYCEGLALGKHPGRASTHAWIEFDGEVIELTWPWDGPSPPKKAVYYGDSIPIDTVVKIQKRRPALFSVLLTDEQYYQQGPIRDFLSANLQQR